MKRVACAIAVVGLLWVGGCVKRQMTITSEPEGALVYVSDVELGRTPLTQSFTWYGDYEIILRKEGYQTLKTHAQISPPPYEVPPIDLFSEIAPWTYQDNRYLHFKMNKLTLPPDAELIRRADQMKKRNLDSVKAP